MTIPDPPAFGVLSGVAGAVPPAPPPVFAVPDTAVAGFGVSVTKTDVVLPGAGSTSLFSGYIKGIVTGINTVTNVADVKVVSRVTTAGVETKIDYEEGAGYA